MNKKAKKHIFNKKQTLVVGSTVMDVHLGIPRFPQRCGDINVTYNECRLGGCAYNVYKTLRLFDSPALLCSPVGTGPYGQMVRDHFLAEGITPFVNLEQENGCCYCLVEPDGERTFLSHHGAEYTFSRSWTKDIDFSLVDCIFICGLEVEEPTGTEIVDFVSEHSECALFFAPGPRITNIPRERMDKIFSRHPILHLNETEACDYAAILANDRSGAAYEVEAAAEILSKHTGNTVVITLGSLGCYYLRGGKHSRKSKKASGFVSGFPVMVNDTTGAGDAHCGALIALLKRGVDISEACVSANRIGAHICSQSYSTLELP